MGLFLVVVRVGKVEGAIAVAFRFQGFRGALYVVAAYTYTHSELLSMYLSVTWLLPVHLLLVPADLSKPFYHVGVPLEHLDEVCLDPGSISLCEFWWQEMPELFQVFLGNRQLLIH